MCILSIGATSTTSASSPNKPITIEAELGFKNIGEQNFILEERPFYSGGAAIKINGSAPVGSKAKVHYNLSSRLKTGQYDLMIHYIDENDGHSPVNIYIGNQVYKIIFDEETESGFESEANQRSALISSVRINKNDDMIIEGEVSRYNSEHKELVRLDKFVFISK